MRDYDRLPRLPRGADPSRVRRAFWELARLCQPGRGDRGQSARPTFFHHIYESLDGRDHRDADGSEWTCGSIWREPGFTDEVDIDFPSVSNFVDHIRDSFFDRAPGHLSSAEVWLTPKQARTGTKVPLSVSLSLTCPVCGGRGEIWLDTCGACAGSGSGLLPHQLRLVVPAGVQDGTYLRFDVTQSYAPVTCVEVRISIR